MPRPCRCCTSCCPGGCGSLREAHAAALEPTPAAAAPALEWETFFPAIDILLIGRHTYETVLTFDPWPFEGKAVVVLSAGLVTDDERVTVARSLDEARSILTDRAGADRAGSAPLRRSRSRRAAVIARCARDTG